MPASTNQAQGFLCDEMLKGFARWLRTAGYDTTICESGISDRELLNQAISEHRLLITRDKKLLEFRHAHGNVIWLRCNLLGECVDALSSQVSINWLYKPFSRCLLCNTSLIPADENLYTRIPETSRAHVKEVLYCRSCDKLYWQGSHVRRMKKQLSEWQHRQGT